MVNLQVHRLILARQGNANSVKGFTQRQQRSTPRGSIKRFRYRRRKHWQCDSEPENQRSDSQTLGLRRSGLSIWRTWLLYKSSGRRNEVNCLSLGTQTSCQVNWYHCQHLPERTFIGTRRAFPVSATNPTSTREVMNRTFMTPILYCAPLTVLHLPLKSSC
jgi:hypothetical protein